MPLPKVAIVTRTMNRPKLLARALDSVLAQDFEDWVWVVVNSGEAGPVEQLIERNASGLRGRVQTVQLDGPGPIGRASNAGIGGSQSDLVVLLDDDDTWEPDFLRRSVAALGSRPEPEARGVVTQTTRIDERSVGGSMEVIRKKPFNPDLASVKLFQLASVNQFTVNAFVYERSAYETVGPYREDLPVLDDWEFNLRFLRQFDILVVPEALANYHVRPEADEGSESANTLTAGEQLHKFYEARIANQHLRDDLARGEAGFGFLMNLAAGHRTNVDLVRDLHRKLLSMSTKVGKIDSRTKDIRDRDRRDG